MKKSSIYVVSLIVLAGLTTSAVYAAATVVPFSPPYQLQDATNGNAVRLNIDSDGNVGIGTASPQEVIDISKSSPSIHMLDLGTSEGGIGFKTADSNLYITNEYGHAYGLGLVSQSIVLTSSGNVGIGTASPQEVIDISKSSPSIHMLDLGTSEGGIGFKTADSNLYITNEYGHAYGLGLVSQSIVLTSSGNVGIGTASPTQALDINGNIRLTGNIVSPNDICIGSC